MHCSPHLFFLHSTHVRQVRLSMTQGELHGQWFPGAVMPFGTGGSEGREAHSRWRQSQPQGESSCSSFIPMLSLLCSTRAKLRLPFLAVNLFLHSEVTETRNRFSIPVQIWLGFSSFSSLSPSQVPSVSTSECLVKDPLLFHQVLQEIKNTFSHNCQLTSDLNLFIWGSWYSFVYGCC